MKKIDPTVKKETLFIATVSLILSMLVQSVFLIIGKWDFTVLLGNIYGCAVSVGNFFLLGLTVQASLTKDADEAKKFIRASQSGRMLLMFVFAIIGYVIPIFNIIAVIIPYLFPRIAVSLRPLIKKD